MQRKLDLPRGVGNSNWSNIQVIGVTERGKRENGTKKKKKKNWKGNSRFLPKFMKENNEES